MKIAIIFMTNTNRSKNKKCIARYTTVPPFFAVSESNVRIAPSSSVPPLLTHAGILAIGKPGPDEAILTISDSPYENT